MANSSRIFGGALTDDFRCVCVVVLLFFRRSGTGAHQFHRRIVQESFRERGHRVSYICLDMIAFLVRTSNVVGFPGLVRLCTGPAFARCEH